MKDRVVYFDLVRLLACVMVVLIHAPRTVIDGSGSNAVIALFSFINAPCIPLFFMLSGALSFPVKRSKEGFLRSRLPRLVIPLLFWSVVVSVIKVFIGLWTTDELFSSIFRLPVVPIEGVYWYLYTAIGLTLFTPIISIVIENSSRKLIEYYLLLWGVTLLLPYYNHIVPGTFSITGNFYAMFYPFAGFLGFMVLGYYINRYQILLKDMISTKRTTLFTILSLMTIFINPMLYLVRMLGYDVDQVPHDLYLVYHVAVMSVLIFIGMRYIRLGDKMGGVISHFAKYTFGIYLVHFMIQREFIWKYVGMLNIGSTLIEVLVISAATLILSYIVIRVLELARVDKRILGM
ncbi:MAG: acyltransferase [Bacteroidales bacterium]